MAKAGMSVFLNQCGLCGQNRVGHGVGHRVGHGVGHRVGHGPGHGLAQVLYTPHLVVLCLQRAHLCRTMFVTKLHRNLSNILKVNNINCVPNGTLKW